MAEDNSYQEEWGRIERIADQVSSLQNRLYRLEAEASRVQSQIAGLSYEPDEEGNDINESTRDSYYAYLESIQSEIEDVNGMRAAASANANELASEYRQQAGQYTERVSHTMRAQSQFQALEGFRFGASTAKAGAALAGQRASHYEDHAAILNDLADAAAQAAYGRFSGSTSTKIGDRGSFHNPGQHESGMVENTGIDFGADIRENQPIDQKKVGSADFSKVSHAGIGLQEFSAHGGNISAGDADEILAGNWETTVDRIREYRDENDLVWVKSQDGVELIPGSVVREYGGDAAKVVEDVSVDDIESDKKRNINELEKYFSTYEERIKQTPKEGGDRGEWENDRGESKFLPNENDKEIKDILTMYGLDGIIYKDAIPDFSDVSESTVEIDNMTENRAENFKQCDEKCAEKWNKEGRDGKTDWSAREDVAQWRKENGYSWHERNDMKTCDLVPTKINDYFGHLGGVSECKKRDAGNDGGDFDE